MPKADALAPRRKLGDIMKIEDAEGHQHGADGRFVSSGGGEYTHVKSGQKTTIHDSDGEEIGHVKSAGSRASAGYSHYGYIKGGGSVPVAQNHSTDKAGSESARQATMRSVADLHESKHGIKSSSRYKPLPYGESVKLARAGGIKGVPIPNMPPNRAHNMEALRDKLLDVGGNAVHIEPDDAETTLIFKKGKLFDNEVENAEKERPDCHGYTARYWWAHRDDPKVKFCTGYATAEHGIWVRHSWIEKDGKILEQTAPRKQYFGVELTPEQAELYIAMRDGIVPGGPLVATPVKRMDYVAEMHARGRGEGKTLEELSGGREVQR